MCSGGPSTGLSLIEMLPAVVRSSPAMQRRSVLLPQPDGPSRLTNFVAPIDSDTFLSAVTPPPRATERKNHAGSDSDYHRLRRL
jgi:hypothetical protein